jgi:acyl-coenzyme A thioesterase PaaI-like protein
VNDQDNDPAVDGAADLLDVTRHLADRVWRSEIPVADRAALAADIERLLHRLEPIFEAAPVSTPIGGRLPGRGHPLLPPLERARGQGRHFGTVEFTSAHAGAGEAVHGGHIALLFDEVLGAVAAEAVMSRTASIEVSYRSLTPMYTRLAVEAWVGEIEGRKIHVEGRLLDGERLCAEARGLFIQVGDWT